MEEPEHKGEWSDSDDGADGGKGKGGKGKKRRQGPGFDDGDEEAATAKKQPKARARKGAADPYANASSAEHQHVPDDSSGAAATATITSSLEDAKSLRSGKSASAAGSELDTEMQVVAKHHLQGDGHSVKALENLDLKFFLKITPNRYAHSAKLKGVPGQSQLQLQLLCLLSHMSYVFVAQGA